MDDLSAHEFFVSSFLTDGISPECQCFRVLVHMYIYHT